jgi:hypothetical protein
MLELRNHGVCTTQPESFIDELMPFFVLPAAETNVLRNREAPVKQTVVLREKGSSFTEIVVLEVGSRLSVDIDGTGRWLEKTSE